MGAHYGYKLSLFTLYQTQKLRFAVSNLFSLQCVELATVFSVTLTFVNGIRSFGFRL